jgi:hypothetical protein
MVNLGFDAARRLVQAGRGAFFPTPDADLPVRQSSILRQDDQIPQLGFVGANYPAHRVLLLGINPGNGGNNQKRIPADDKMMPAMYAFAREPTERNFVAASHAYQTGFETWGPRLLRCAELFGPGKLAASDVAYATCLPWRTGSKPPFTDDVMQKAATLFLRPLIEDLAPAIIVAMGKTDVPKFLQMTGLRTPPVIRPIPWNRSQAATPAALNDRRAAAARILNEIGR